MMHEWDLRKHLPTSSSNEQLDCKMTEILSLLRHRGKAFLKRGKECLQSGNTHFKLSKSTKKSTLWIIGLLLMAPWQWITWQWKGEKDRIYFLSTEANHRCMCSFLKYVTFSGYLLASCYTWRSCARINSFNQFPECLGLSTVNYLLISQGLPW